VGAKNTYFNSISILLLIIVYIALAEPTRGRVTYLLVPLSVAARLAPR
jgi:hypothetical protein